MPVVARLNIYTSSPAGLPQGCCGQVSEGHLRRRDRRWHRCNDLSPCAELLKDVEREWKRHRDLRTAFRTPASLYRTLQLFRQ